jgi:hypothetical protein
VSLDVEQDRDKAHGAGIILHVQPLAYAIHVKRVEAGQVHQGSGSRSGDSRRRRMIPADTARGDTVTRVKSTGTLTGTRVRSTGTQMGMGVGVRVRVRVSRGGEKEK